jgi:hypothetical protein
MGSVKMKVVDSAAVRAQKIKTPMHKVKNTVNMDIEAVMKLIWGLLGWGLDPFSSFLELLLDGVQHFEAAAEVRRG